jgi:hypothetical protein
MVKLKAGTQGGAQAVAVLLALSVTLPPGLHSQAPPREWKLSPAPSVAIGGDGRPETEFFQVNRAWRLADGAIAVVNGGSKEIRVFDARGAYLHSFGRNGEGPGEFRHFGWTGHFADTAVVYDGSLRRITTIHLEGPPRLLAALPIAARDDRGFNVVGRVEDGRWLVHALGRPDVNALGFQRIPGFAGLIDARATGGVEWLAEAPDLSIIIHSPDIKQKQVEVTPAAFPSSFAMAASGPAIWFGDTAAGELVKIDAASGIRTTIQLPDAPAPLTKGIVDASRKREIDAARDQASRDVVEVKYSARHLPKRMPVFQALVAGMDGELWVQRFAPSRAGPTQYVVLAANGQVVARVAVASGFRVTDVGHNYVVGVHKDDDGVESVLAYTLTRR